MINNKVYSATNIFLFRANYNKELRIEVVKITNDELYFILFYFSFLFYFLFWGLRLELV